MTNFDADVNVSKLSKELGMSIRLVEASCASIEKVEKNHVSTSHIPAKDVTIDVTTGKTMLSASQKRPQRVYVKRQMQPLPHTPRRLVLQLPIATWATFKRPRDTNGAIYLAGDDSFSPAFECKIGIGNVTNVSKLDDECILESIFEELLNSEASRQFRSQSNRYLEDLVNLSGGRECDGVIVSSELGAHGKLRWRINYGEWEEGTWTDLLYAILGLPRLDIMATLANILGMQFESLYQLYNTKDTTKLNAGRLKANTVPKVLYLPRRPPGPACAELFELVKIIRGHNHVIAAITMYRLDGRTFCLPAAVVQGELSLGRSKSVAYFLNQHLIDNNPYAIIVFCQDMRTALALQRILDETRVYNPSEIIVTGHLGESLDGLPWNYFWGHDVVFVCAPTKMCMAMVKAYEAYVRGARAKSFHIHLGFLLHSPAGYDLQGEIEGVTGAEAELLHGAVWLDTVERPTWLIAQMVKNAVSYEEYLEWGRNLGIFKTSKSYDHSKTTVSSDDLVLFSATTKDVAPQPTSIDDVTVKHICPRKRNVLIHGLKDAGKSFISQGITKAVCCGEALFGNFLSDGGSNAMYINSETPKEDFTQRLAQFDLVEIVGQHLFVLSKYDHTATDCVFSLTDAIFREKVATLLQKHDCHYLILDNLTSLMDDGQATQAIALSKVYAWVEALQQRGVCVILVHHTKDDSKAGTCSAKSRGSQDASIRGHTEIVLISSTQIIEQNRGPECVQLAAAQDGLTVGVLFKVCKSACILQKKTFWLRLPLGASEWQILAVTDALGNLVEHQPVSEVSTGTDMTHLSDGQAVNLTANPFPTYCDKGATGIPNRPGMLAGCTDDECKVYEYIRDNGRAQNSDIRKILDCKATKAGEVLDLLIGKELIKREGKGPQTHYRLP